LELQVATLTPLFDDFGLFFVIGAGGVVAGLEGDGAAWGYILGNQMKLAICLIFLVLVRRPRLLSRIEPEYIDN
jgi:Na+-driven multidrug efflux pump